MTKPQLFLLHFAGGNAYSYQFLLPHLSAFEAIPLELPGRGKRMRDALLKNYDEAVDDLFQQLTTKRNGDDYLIYGHSMGARLGLSISKKLEEKGDPPLGLVASGNAGPGSESEEPDRHLMPHDEFIASLKELGGIPEEVLENKELLDFFEPVLRADFELIEKNKSEQYYPIDTPIYAVMGQDEKTSDQIEGWNKFTTSTFNHHLWPGNHFFIHDHATRLALLLKDFTNTLITNTVRS